MTRIQRIRVRKSSKTLMKREDRLFFPTRLADPILNHHSWIFLNQQAPVYRSPLFR